MGQSMRTQKYSIALTLLLFIPWNPAAMAQSFAIEDTTALDSLRGSMIRLNWAEKEVTSISELMNGEVYCYNRATEKTFKEKAPQAGRSEATKLI